MFLEVLIVLLFSVFCRKSIKRLIHSNNIIKNMIAMLYHSTHILYLQFNNNCTQLNDNFKLNVHVHSSFKGNKLKTFD